jgi:hypothetical protein
MLAVSGSSEAQACFDVTRLTQANRRISFEPTQFRMPLIQGNPGGEQ